MRSALRRMGNSSGIIVPKAILAELGAKVGDDVELSVEEGRLVVTPVKRNPRAGWAEDAKRLAEAGDDALVWPEFGNDGDSELKW